MSNPNGDLSYRRGTGTDEHQSLIYGESESGLAAHDCPLLAYSVEKLRFQKRRFFISDLPPISYRSYEEVV
jgi:hypothetical protein